MRALAGAGLLVVAVEVVRLPAITRDYAAAIAAQQRAGRVASRPLLAARPATPAAAVPSDDKPPAPLRAAAPPAMPARATGTAHHRSAERFAPPLWSTVPGPLPAQTAAMPPDTPPAPPPDPAPAAETAFDLATTGYARLAAGNRRGAAQALDAALAAGPGHPNAAAWLAVRRRLGRRWSGDGWWLLRQGSGSSLAASPVLGGGQAGGSLAYTLDPLARRPLAVVARVAVAALPARRGIAPRGLDSDGAQFAVGLRWTLAPGVSVTAERLIAAGPRARDDWAARLAAGTGGSRGRTVWSLYGEAGVIAGGDTYAGGQARAALRIDDGGALRISAGPAAWASIQHGPGQPASSRVDLGPSLAVHLPLGRAGFDVAADYRFRVAGNASPGNGPVVTVSAAF